jgi:ElaA protein
MQFHSELFEALTAQTLYQLLRLRAEVFVVEQNCVYQDLDDLDIAPETQHLWLTAPNGEIASYLRVLKESNECPFRISRVVTARAYRKKGYAAQLIQHVITDFPTPIILHAESYLKQWYEKLGFIVTSQEFLIDGIPHYTMQLS